MRRIKVGSDLTISSLTTPSTGGAGLGVAVVLLEEQWPGQCPYLNHRPVLVIDSQLGGGDTLLGSISVPALAAGADSTDTIDVTIPESAASGDYYLIAKADAPGAITETKETNNIRSRRIKVGSDLTISSLTTPSTGGAGLGVAVSVTTKNNGPGNAPAQPQTCTCLQTLNLGEEIPCLAASRYQPLLQELTVLIR